MTFAKRLLSSSPRSKSSDSRPPKEHTPSQSSQPTSILSKQSSTLSLPRIDLLTATGQNVKTEDRMTTLFRPPSPSEARRQAKQHAQFGPLGSPSHRYSSRFTGDRFPDPIEENPPYYFLLTTYVSYLILIIFGHIRDFFGKRFKQQNYQHLRAQDGYAPLNEDFDNFYVRRLKMRINDCFARPTTGVPGRYINLVDRVSDDGNLTFNMTGTTTETLNMSSYNYLGFAQSEGPCADAVEASVRKHGITFASPRADAGTSELHIEVEGLIARFVGKQDSMLFSMGFGTNSTIFPALVGRGCLVISDELNHASIRTGIRLCGAMVQTFKHNDMADLERLLRDTISQGQPRTHRPWKKILVAVEGLYSMEGTMCNLPTLVKLRRRYKFHLFVDEAHSIGALGPRGRGVCDYFDVDPAEVDVLMGTLTKSFGANGGYVAADQHIVDKLRVTNSGTTFGESPSPLVLTQIAASLRIIIGELCPGQGEERLQRLAFNSRYLRLGLKRLGFIVTGQDDAPIVPLMLYNPAKISAFSHEMLARKISVVVVGYPATPLVSSRARFCVSSAHTKDDLDRLLEACDIVGEVLQLKNATAMTGGIGVEEVDYYGGPSSDANNITMNGDAKTRANAYARRKHGQEESKGARRSSQSEEPIPPRWKLEDVIARGVQDVKSTLPQQ
ncbi:MAG: serine palmitoyltransferase component [Alyxoria varia]|nr:MAG: serine palmitoyltransferase component [Alyxoria varia]